MDATGTTLRDVAEWGLGQAVHLTPTQHHVLMYLVLSAFLSDTNPEGAYEGQVYRKRTSMVAIRKHTGYSERAVRDALRALQEKAYIVSDLKAGWGRSRILVMWGTAHEELREDMRAGVRDLPEFLRRPVKERNSPAQEGNIVEFPYRQHVPQ